jgi:transcription-repair coupling factor (superfamily II helicase)
LFGHDVDSIRIVDPETQLSERKLLQVSIIPNVDTQFENVDRISLFDFLPENTVVWIQDYELCKERLEDCEEDLQAFLRMMNESGPLPGRPIPIKIEKKKITADDFTVPAILKSS